MAKLKRWELILPEEDCLLVGRCATLQLYVAAMRYPVHAENNFSRSVEVVGVLQDKKVWAKLGYSKLRAIADDVHFHLCRMSGLIGCHG